MNQEDVKYGCIDETSFSFRSPRCIDGDECNTVEQAFLQALDLIEQDAEQVAICKVKYYGEDGNGYWGEIVGEGQILIDASNANWKKEDVE